MSARDAVSAAEQYVQALLDKERMIGRNFPGWAALRDLHISSALTSDPAPILGEDAYTAAERHAARYQSKRLFDEIRFTAAEAGQRRLWQQYRIVYDVDPALWAELGDTETDAVIPTDLWSRLPHPDPFITLPEPLVLSVDEDTQQRILGFFVRGQADMPPPEAPGTHFQCSTASPVATTLGATFAGFVETKTGKPIFSDPGVRDVIWSRVTLDPRVGQHTVAEMIEHTVTRFTGYRTPTADTDVPLMIRRAVTLLVYLCATNADLTPLPRQSAAGTGPRGKGAKAKPSVPIGVGYRVGAALAAYRRHQQAEAAEHTGRKKAPHVRRAHFHTYRVGPGKRETEVKWLSPIPVNMHEDPAQTTVIPVRPLSRSGSNA